MDESFLAEAFEAEAFFARGADFGEIRFAGAFLAVDGFFVAAADTLFGEAVRFVAVFFVGLFLAGTRTQLILSRAAVYSVSAQTRSTHPRSRTRKRLPAQ